MLLWILVGPTLVKYVIGASRLFGNRVYTKGSGRRKRGKMGTGDHISLHIYKIIIYLKLRKW